MSIGGEEIWVLPPEAGLTFLMDVAVPYVEAVFFRGMPFLGTVSYNAQARQISPDISDFKYGALYADPIPSMGAGIPPSLCMQDMYRHLPEELSLWYDDHGRGRPMCMCKSASASRSRCSASPMPPSLERCPIRSTAMIPSSRRPIGPMRSPGQGA